MLARIGLLVPLSILLLLCSGCLDSERQEFADSKQAGVVDADAGASATPNRNHASNDASALEMGIVNDAHPMDVEMEMARPEEARTSYVEICSSTPCRLPLPDLSRAVDLDTFQVPDRPALGSLVPRAQQTPGHITVPPDLYQARLPACRYPVRMGSPATLSPTIDGDLRDWEGVAPVAIDRDGDMPSTDADYDMLRVYYASDASFHYFAFTFKNKWPDGNRALLQLQFEHVTLPKTEKDQVQFSPYRVLVPVGASLYEYTTGTPTASLSTERFAMAGKDRVMEMRIARTEIEGKLGPGLWSFTPRSVAGTGSDTVGATMVGLTPDYGCLVPMPEKRSKLFVFRHADDVDPTEAEVINRAVIAAAPFAEQAAGDSYDLLDTIDVTTVRTMATDGVHTTRNGIFMSNERKQGLLSDTGIADRFIVAAHEYAHGLNSDEYDLPKKWMKEGHSEWVAHRAAAAALGPALAQYERFSAAATFLEEETSNHAVSLEAEPWPQPARTLEFHYAKASILTDLLGTVILDGGLRRVQRKAKTDGAPYGDGAAFLKVLMAQPEYQGSPLSATPWNGWFSTNYAGTAFPQKIVRADADHDGLLDYQEIRMGLSVTSADTDGDGVSDGFEIAAGTDPKIPDVLRSLVMDGILDDWDRLVPEAMQFVSSSKSNPSACEKTPGFVRAGAVFDGDWLAVGFELASVPVDSIAVTVDVNDDSGRRWDLEMTNEMPEVYGFAGDDRIRSAIATAPMSGKQGEIYYHRSWLGWSEGVPEGLRIYVATFTGASQCELTSALPLTTSVP